MVLFAVGLYFLNIWLMKVNMANKLRGEKSALKTAAEPVCYAVFSAIFGTQAVVQAKALAVCVEQVAFDHFFLWVRYTSPPLPLPRARELSRL